jgi:hypothetical protein
VKPLACVLVAVAALAGHPTRASAEDVVAYQAEGDADAAAADARIEALDQAFGKAVAQALGDVLDPEVRRRQRAVLDREVIGRARLWVAKFTVTKESVSDERKLVAVSVRIDRDKLRARLAELHIATRTGDAESATGPSVTVLLRVVSPDGIRASYGVTADKELPGLAAIASALRRAGMVIKRAPASGPAASAEGELPLDDDTAQALAVAARAEQVAIAGVTIGAPVALRGVDATAALVTARVRVLHRQAGVPIGHGSAAVAARSTEPTAVAAAIDRALTGALGDALPPAAQALAPPESFTGDDRPVTEPGIILVRLARATPWGMVQAEIKHLTGARGVSRASLRHVSPAGWVIGVATGESIERIASIVKKPPAADTSAVAKIVDDVIEATLSGAPGAP